MSILKNASGHLTRWGWLAILVLIVALLLVVSYTRPAKVVVDQAGDVFRSPDGVHCLEGWTETAGVDPDTRVKFKSCTSPDKRYLVTVRENQKPVGFDGESGRFLSDDETAGYLR